jgi:phospholipid transport system substrate-binding protein
MKKLLIGLILTVFLIFPFYVRGGAPLETIQKNVNDLLVTLRDPALQGESGKRVKTEKIEFIADKMFDYIELSKLTLSRNWKKLAPDQQKEFVKLYRAVLEKAYVNKILSYKDEKVVFKKEIKLSGEKVEVQSEIVTTSKTIPIYYRMILRNAEWKVYDVIIEGISLMKNYRGQFKHILSKKSPEDLLELMRKKASQT